MKGGPESPRPGTLLSYPNHQLLREEEQKPLLQKAAVHVINFAIVKIICKICIINIIKSLVGETSDVTRVKGSLGRTGP